jgi:hypothetical protein
MTIQEYIKVLFEVQINTQIAHWQTTSYAEHMALQTCYLNIVDLRDSLVESLQSENLITGYKSPILNENMEIISFLEGVIDDSKVIRELLESDAQNIVDEIITLLKSTIYKLKFLK